MHNLPLDCMWVINVDPGWKVIEVSKNFQAFANEEVDEPNLIIVPFLLQIQIAFLQFQLERPNDCDSNFVDVFGEQTDIPNR